MFQQDYHHWNIWICWGVKFDSYHFLLSLSCNTECDLREKSYHVFTVRYYTTLVVIVQIITIPLTIQRGSMRVYIILWKYWLVSEHILKMSNCFPIWVGEMGKLVSYLISFTLLMLLTFHIILKKREGGI